MTDIKRAECLKIIFDYVRDKNDICLQYGSRGDDMLPLMKWLRGLDSSTLAEAIKTRSFPEPKHSQIVLFGRDVWGNGIDLLLSASKHGLDETTAALGLFAATIVDPMPQGPEVVQKGATDDDPLIYWEAMEYVSGLYDTLRYHPDALNAEHYPLLMDGNVLSVTSTEREGIAALLTVTNRVIQAGLDGEFCQRSERNQHEEPYRLYTGYSEHGSIWLRNGELVKYVLANSSNSAFIADVIAERKTDDPAVIAEILEQGTLSLASGVL